MAEVVSNRLPRAVLAGVAVLISLAIPLGNAQAAEVLFPAGQSSAASFLPSVNGFDISRISFATAGQPASVTMNVGENAAAIDLGAATTLPAKAVLPLTGYGIAPIPAVENHLYLVRLAPDASPMPTPMTCDYIFLLAKRVLAGSDVTADVAVVRSYELVLPGGAFRLANAGEDPTKQVVMTLTSDPPTLPADGVSVATVQAVVTTAVGVPIKNRPVSFVHLAGNGRLIPIQPVTDEAGVARATYTAGVTADTSRLSAIDTTSGASTQFEIPLSISASIDVNLVNPATYVEKAVKRIAVMPMFTLTATAFPDKMPADGISLSFITAHLTYKDGRTAAGFPLTFAVRSGGGSITPRATMTDKQGNLQAVYQAGKLPGTALIVVTEPSSGLSATVEITLVEGGPAKIKLSFRDQSGGFSPDAATLPADGGTTVQVVATVTNLFDMPMPGYKVQFSLKNRNGRIELLDPVTDANGQVVATYYAGTLVGVETITAFLESKPLTP